MKICFVSYEYPPNTIGGAGTYAKELVTGLTREGQQVIVVTRGKKNLGNNIISIDVKRKGILGRLFFIRKVTALLPSIVVSMKIDLFHFNEPYILTKTRLPVPIVTTYHNLQSNNIRAQIIEFKKNFESPNDLIDFVLINPIGSIAEILTAHSSNTIICPSPILENEIVSFCHVSRNKVRFIPNGIDIGAFNRTQNDESEILVSHDLNKGGYLLFIGRLHPMKGIEFLFKAFKTIKINFPNLKLVITGSGEMEQRLKKVATKGIIFTGQINKLEDKKTLIKNSAIVIIPSIFESMPMVALEALACGKPIIATATGAIPLMVKHNFNGYLVKPKNVQGIEKAVKYIIENSDLRQRMELNSRSLAENFSVEKMAKKTIEVYKTTINNYL